jgi:hypothetical protein
VPDVLILIVCVALLTLALGLPLLLKPDSLIPDIIASGILAVAVLTFVWGTGAYWITFPIFALVAFVAWLDRGGQNWPRTLASGGGDRRAEALGAGVAGTNGRTQFRFGLWRTAIRVQMAMGACVVILLAAGFMRSLELIVPWMVIVGVAMVVFRFSFFRSCRRDELVLAGEAGATAYPG